MLLKTSSGAYPEGGGGLLLLLKTSSGDYPEGAWGRRSIIIKDFFRGIPRGGMGGGGIEGGGEEVLREGEKRGYWKGKRGYRGGLTHTFVNLGT